MTFFCLSLSNISALVFFFAWGYEINLSFYVFLRRIIELTKSINCHVLMVFHCLQMWRCAFFRFSLSLISRRNWFYPFNIFCGLCASNYSTASADIRQTAKKHQQYPYCISQTHHLGAVDFFHEKSVEFNRNRRRARTSERHRNWIFSKQIKLNSLELISLTWHRTELKLTNSIDREQHNFAVVGARWWHSNGTTTMFGEPKWVWNHSDKTAHRFWVVGETLPLSWSSSLGTK